MRTFLALTAVTLLAGVLAGCMQGEGGEPGPATFGVDPMPLDLLPAERPVASSTTWHEEVQRTTPRPVDSGFVIENEWEPRDVDLTYHGVQPVYDEWGREVEAHVFRYEVMGLEITNVDIVAGDLQITARYEPSLYEFLFERSTGRSLGLYAIDGQMRTFADHRWPAPWAPTYAGDLLLPVAYQAVDGDWTTRVPSFIGGTWLNETDLRPLEGDCQPYEYETDYAPWYQQWIDSMRSPEDEVEEELPEDEQHSIVCLEEDGQPLWVFSGNQSDHLRLTRQGPALPTPRLEGSALQARAVASHPYEDVGLLLGLAQPVAMPPSAYPGDWADQIRPVSQAVGTNLDYVQWQMDREALFLSDVSMAFPYFGVPLVPLVPVDPLGFETTSWVWVSDGGGFFWAMVDSRYGTVEDPDIHLSRNGFAFDDRPLTQRDLVASGEVQAMWETLLPVEADFLSFSVFPDILGELPPEYIEYLTPFLTTWSAQEFCFQDHAPGRFAAFSAINGQMTALGAQTSHANGCFSGVEGDGFMRLDLAGQDVLLRPATPTQPALLVVPGAGKAFALGRGNALPADALRDALAA